MEAAAFGTVRAAGITACAPDKNPSGRLFISGASSVFLIPSTAPSSAESLWIHAEAGIDCV